ncbi:MAG: hypothetical protein OEZ39_19650 [Gammaproteobacteria bacterium]|nr:hypothetical protein [Gammaproteobacteria bacterium]MDH5654082.1 hypothetical protein [Gammaproteobacteria bacterium]
MPPAISLKYPHISTGLFLLLSFLLHGLLLFVISNLHKSIPPQDTVQEKFSVRLQPILPEKKNKPAHANHQSEKQPAPTQHRDILQKSMETLHRLLKQPGFLEQFEQKESFIQDYQKDLVEDKPRSVRIESYQQRPGGEVMVIFRTAAGKKLCILTSEPNPFDAFATGSWQLVLTGC